MTTSTPHSNGVLHGPLGAPASPGARRSAWIWPTLLVSLIGLNVAIVGVTVYFAVSDTSVAAEPDYYAKALKYDDTIRLREQSGRLGWTAQPAVAWSDSGDTPACTVTLADRDGRPISEAHVAVVAFAGVRSDIRQSLVLEPSPRTPGEYRAPLRLDRAGLWRFRISVTRAGDEFFRETDVMVHEHHSTR
ncbi:MAG TPA: FixH family protein [Phycisphaerales bacterium]|nr:FixH family protein [Phycisphaerales bacterium]